MVRDGQFPQWIAPLNARGWHEGEGLGHVETGVKDEVRHRTDEHAAGHLGHIGGATVTVSIVPDFDPLHRGCLGVRVRCPCATGGRWDGEA